MSERPIKATSEGQPEGNPLGELMEGFDEIYGNIEGFSKRAVGSLFDDDENTDDKSIKHDTSHKSTKTNRPERPSASYGREPSPDEDYARYIRTAEKANRMEQEKHRADKQQAITERDEKLNEISYVAKRRVEPEIKPIARSRDTEEASLYMPAQRSQRQFNIRNLVAVGAFIMLVIFALLTWQMLSARSQLAAANERIEGLAPFEQQVVSLNITISGLENDIVQLNNRIEEYLNQLQGWEALFGSDPDAAIDGDADDIPDASEPDNTDVTIEQTPSRPTQGDLPHTTINAQGQRVYTMQPNDTIWSIAIRIYGNGNRFSAILNANDLTEAQASLLPPGTILIIPD